MKNYLQEFVSLTEKEKIIHCIEFPVPIIGKKLGAGGFGSIFTVHNFPNKEKFKKAHKSSTYLIKVLESVPAGIKKIYMDPRNFTKAGKTVT